MYPSTSAVADGAGSGTGGVVAGHGEVGAQDESGVVARSASKSANSRQVPGVSRSSGIVQVPSAVQRRVHVLEAGQVPADDDQVQLLLVASRRTR